MKKYIVTALVALIMSHYLQATLTGSLQKSQSNIAQLRQNVKAGLNNKQDMKFRCKECDHTCRKCRKV